MCTAVHAWRSVAGWHSVTTSSDVYMRLCSCAVTSLWVMCELGVAVHSGCEVSFAGECSSWWWLVPYSSISGCSLTLTPIKALFSTRHWVMAQVLMSLQPDCYHRVFVDKSSSVWVSCLACGALAGLRERSDHPGTLASVVRSLRFGVTQETHLMLHFV